jgi:DNA gyrase subunit A
VLIRTRVNEVREMSRSTQGVTLINLSGGEKLSGLQCIFDRDDENGENGNGNHQGEEGPGHAQGAAGEEEAGGEGAAGGEGETGGGEGGEPA